MYAVLAHVGHGDPVWSPTLLHYLLDLQHAWPTWMVLALFALIATARRRAR